LLHVVTVHFRSEAWIEPQLRYLRRFAPPGTEVWASLDGIERRGTFDHETSLDGSHADKLNELARLVSEVAAPDDHLLFLDGDAFPVAPLAPVLAAGAPLVAAQRRDPPLPVPHACFCLTTVGTWNDIDGDWSAGSYYWQGGGREAVGEVTNTGATLKVRLDEAGLEWLPLRRLNARPTYPMTAFTIFGDDTLGPVVYHHGAGFRARANPLPDCWIPSSVPVFGRLERSIRFRGRRMREDRGAKKVYEMIVRDDDLVARFVSR
jgi:hypothetical protein